VPGHTPKYIHGAKALYIAESDTIFEIRTRNDQEVSIKFLSVCQYDDHSGFYLFGCDEEFNTYTDFYFDDIDVALEDAKRLYQIDNIEWKKIS